MTSETNILLWFESVYNLTLFDKRMFELLQVLKFTKISFLIPMIAIINTIQEFPNNILS